MTDDNRDRRHFRDKPHGQPPPAPPPRVGSPWFNRYGGWSDTLQNEYVAPPNPHSGFAPNFPKAWPKQGDKPRRPGPHPGPVTEDLWDVNPDPNDVFGYPLAQPSWSDMDLLFATEQQQIEANSGMTTAEAIYTSRRVQGSSLMDCDEDNWNTVFNRTKWYDLNWPIINEKHFPAEVVPDFLDGLWWTPADPDNPLWMVMEPAIELANQWLREMSKGE